MRHFRILLVTAMLLSATTAFSGTIYDNTIRCHTQGVRLLFLAMWKATRGLEI